MSNENNVFERGFYLVNAQNAFLEAEIGTKNNFFYEIGVGFNNFDEAYILKDIGYLTTKGHAFSSLRVYGGYGKRIVLNNNLN